MKRKRKAIPGVARDKFLYLRAVLADPTLSASAKCVLSVLVIVWRNDETGLCIPGLAKIAEHVGRSRRAVVPAVAELSTSGWLKITSTKGGSKSNTNQYVIDIKQRVPVKDTTPLPVKQTSPVKQNAEGVSYTAHEPSLNIPALKARGCVGEMPAAPAPVGAALGEESKPLAESFEQLCTIWSKRSYGDNKPKALKAFRLVCDDDPAEQVLASAARWAAATPADRMMKLEEWLSNGAWRKEPPVRGAERAGRRRKEDPVEAMMRAGGWEPRQ